MKRLFLLSLALLSMACMMGCKKGDSVEAELRNVIERNLKATQDEDLETALMDIDDGLKANSKGMLKVIFNQYDLSYKLLDFKIISIDGDTAKVEVVLETKKIKGPAFQDNVSTSIHTMKKRSNGWKLTETKIKEFKAL